MKKIKKKITAKQREEWFEAVRFQDINTIKKMIEEGVDVNCKNPYGWTALHWSCYREQLNMIKFLIKNGADVNIQNDEHLRTPLHFACYLGNLDITKLLMDNGADITARDKDGGTPLDDLKRHHPQEYEELTEWLTENHPEKLLEYMASENSPSKGVGL